ncbi:MAG: glycine/sarcosine/betaine reductase selenoprotein B family protein [Acidimicrobiia bacterium]|nr:glycine/sarcosine/betaine reductase selenoprotein B family protein [Acidimicrobiia bacterium]
MLKPMEPVRYVDRLNARYAAQGFPPYRWTVNEEAPLTPLSKPLADSRVTLLTSGGVSRACDAAWDPDARNDFRLDEIPADTAASAFQVHDSYYDVTAARDDINCVFPVDRLNELATEGVVGAIAPRLWSGFMGRIYKRTQLRDVIAPAWAEELRLDDVDLAILVPA